MADAQQRFSLIGAKSLVDLRKLMGSDRGLRSSRGAMRQSPTISGMVRMGIGDDNPLWSDPQYARRRPLWSSAAPAIVYICFETDRSADTSRMAGVHAIVCGYRCYLASADDARRSVYDQGYGSRTWSSMRLVSRTLDSADLPL